MSVCACVCVSLYMYVYMTVCEFPYFFLICLYVGTYVSMHACVQTPMSVCVSVCPFV